VPDILSAEKAGAELASLAESGASSTEIALDVFLWGARSQLFWDGNKRTSLLAANKVLVASGAGLLTINEWNMDAFNTLLSSYYESGDGAALKEFLYENAIEGITF
jgi:prophage maintenance system killer protein